MSGNPARPVRVPIGGLIHPRDRHEARLRANLRDKARILISSTHLRRRIAGLAAAIIRDTRRARLAEIHLAVVLKGATVFVSDLMREIFLQDGPPIRFSYISASSYGRGRHSSGKIKIRGMASSLANREVVIVEDIADTGLTLMALKQHLIRRRGAAAVKICVLLDKPARRLPQLRRSLQMDYIGFKVPNVFVAGYGTDCADHFRELPFVVAMTDVRGGAR